MSAPGYVLCKWKKLLWPAKVLSQASPSSGNSLVHVQILCLDEQIHVKHKDTKPLEKVEVEKIADELASRVKTPHAPIKELTYRKALRIALDCLNQNPSSEHSHLTADEVVNTGKTESRAQDCKSVTTTQVVVSKEAKRNSQKKILQKSASISTVPKEITHKGKKNDDTEKRENMFVANAQGSGDAKLVPNEPVLPTRAVRSIQSSTNRYTGKKRTRDPKSDIGNEASEENKLAKECTEVQKSPKIPTEQNKLLGKNRTKCNKQELLAGSTSSDSPESSKLAKIVGDAASKFTSSECNELQGIQQTTKRKRIQNLNKHSSEHNRASVLCQQEPALFAFPQVDTPTLDKKAEISKENALDLSGKNCTAVEEHVINKRIEDRASPMPEEECASNLNIHGKKPIKRKTHLARMRKIRKAREEVSKRNESSETDTEKVAIQPGNTYTHDPIPQFEDEKGIASSELSMEIGSTENYTLNPTWPEEDTEEDEELPSVLLQQGPASIEPGMFVWCKFHKYPYWPSVVKNVRRKDRKATVLFVEESLSNPSQKKKGISVSLRNLKPYDCAEKNQLLAEGREDYGESIDWCEAIISDYRIRMGCGSFSGSFTDYCTADISYPVRRELQQGKSLMFFPSVDTDHCESSSEVTPSKSQPNRKVLPDRQRAARDRANERLVEFIVKTKQAESHILEILRGKKSSRWLRDFQASNRHIKCIETYLEDEEQVELVVGYLQALCEDVGSSAQKLMNKNQMGFVLDVLLPEAVIFAISAIDKVNYEKAEKKYLEGPSVSKRERNLFEEQILQKKKLQDLQKLGTKKESDK
ncbi:PWWP domain-containing DNA repair factor 3A isoform 1-T3 [Discoglossus pictus]